MPFVQHSNVPISFKGGLQSKSDDFQISPDSLLELENCVFDKIGRLNKRYGYDILPKTVVSGNQITSAFAIDNFNNELNLFDNRFIYTYASQNNNWVNRGTAISLINTNNQIVRTAAAQQLNPDSATINNIELYCWEDSRGTVRYSTIDTATSSYLVNDRIITNSIGKPKVVPFNDKFYVFYTNNNNLYYRTVDPDNPSVISNQTAIIATGYTDFVYDIHVSDGANPGLYIVYFGDDAGQVIGVTKLTTAGVVTNTNIISGSIINDNNYTSIGISIDSAEQLWVVWSSGTDLNYTVRQASNPATIILATTTIASVVVPNLAIIESADQDGTMQVFYQINAAQTYNHRVVSTNLTNTGVITTAATIRSVGLASKAFNHNNLLHINVVHESTLQNTYFTVFLNESQLTIIGKISPQIGGGLSSNGMLPEVNSPIAGEFVFANLVKGQFISESNTNFSLLGVNSTKIDFNNTSKFNSVTSSRNLLFVGGILQSYDGASVVEQNFHIFPENVSAVYSSTGGSLSVGQYQYVVVYSWTDKAGQIQYSTPSVPPLTVTSTDVTGSTTLTIPTLRLTAKTDVIIKVYRTQVNSVVFQEVTSELVPLENDPTVDTVTFLDTVADVDMAANAPVYTTGGVLPNVAPPSAKLICNYQDRVMLAGIEQDPNVIWFSKNKFNNSNFNTIPTEFSSSNTISVNPLGGPITAIIEMDGQLIIFKRSSIFVLTGEGPNDTGGGNSFPNAQLFNNSVGCDNPNSVVFTKNGVMFQSEKGLWLIPRGLGEPQYIGAGVDTLAKDFTITSATVDPNDNLIIFTTDNGSALVYEYLINQWTTFTNHQAVDSLPFNNLFAFCKANGDVYVQNRASFMDGTKAIKAKIVTPWMSFANMQGYQSVARAFLLGEFKSGHTLRVKVGYDFNPAFADRDIADINATTLAGSNLWGSSTPWGDDSFWGGEHQLYQFQINFARQRCTSFRISIEDIQTEDFGEGFTISNMSFDVGAIGGHNRLPVTKKVSTRT